MQDVQSEFGRELTAAVAESERVLGYRLTRTRQMMGAHGPLEAARKLIQMPATSGLTDLYLHGRLDLSFEWLALQHRFRPLFTPDELRVADKTLREHGFKFLPDYQAP